MKFRGFSIIELLLYTAILSSFLLMLTNVFVTMLEVQLESQASSVVVSDSRYLFARMAYDLGRASAIVEPVAIGAQSQSLIITVGGQTYTYAVVGDDLILTTASASGALNSFQSNVSNVSFRRYGNMNGKNSVRVFVRLTSRTLRQGEPEVRDFDTILGTR